MEALVKRTDSFKKHDYFWIIGVNKKALWKQLDALQDCSSSCRNGNYYDIVAFRENGITTDAYTGQQIQNVVLSRLKAGSIRDTTELFLLRSVTAS